jgi:DNA-binding NarL/FixJ family response regulator
VIRLLVVDRNQTMRDIMRLVLGDEPDMQIAGFASDVEEALRQMDGSNVVLVSASLPENEACEIISAVSRAWTRVLAIDVPDCGEGAHAYLAAGAAACVLEQESLDELVTKVRAVYNGGSARPLAEG